MIINVNPFGRYEHVKRVMDFSNTAMAVRIRQQAVRKLPPPDQWGAGRKRSPPRKKSLPPGPAPEPDLAMVEDDADPAAYPLSPSDGADWDGDETGLLERVRRLRQAVRAPRPVGACGWPRQLTLSRRRPATAVIPGATEGGGRAAVRRVRGSGTNAASVDRWGGCASLSGV